MTIEQIIDGENAGSAFGKINQALDVVNNVDPEVAILMTKNAEDQVEINADVIVTGQVEINADVIVTGQIYAPTPMFQIQHRLPGATDSGGFTAGEWRNRPLNTVAWNDMEGASFDPATFLFTLPAGLYEIDGISMAFYVQFNTARLVEHLNETNVIIIGDAGISNANPGYNNSGSNFRGRFELPQETTIRLQHWCSVTRAANGFGRRAVAAIDNTDAIYADLRFWKLQ